MRKRMRARGLMDKVDKFVKDKRLISTALGFLGQPGLAMMARTVGLGRRRRRVRGGARRRSVNTTSQRLINY